MRLAGLLAACLEGACVLPPGSRPGFPRQLGRAVLHAQVPPNPCSWAASWPVTGPTPGASGSLQGSRLGLAPCRLPAASENQTW